MECAVSALRDVDWSPESFDCLQIPSETKTMLLLLTKTRLGLIPTVPFDDVIDGKGQGLNIFLKYVGKVSAYSVKTSTLTQASGLLGVGKTFTVEVTSEYFKLPLYSVGALRGADCGLTYFARYPQANLLLTTEILMRLKHSLKSSSKLRSTLMLYCS